MARKKTKSYFSDEQEDAVKEYLTTTNDVKKNKILMKYYYLHLQ